MCHAYFNIFSVQIIFLFFFNFYVTRDGGNKFTTLCVIISDLFFFSRGVTIYTNFIFLQLLLLLIERYGLVLPSLILRRRRWRWWRMITSLLVCAAAAVWLLLVQKLQKLFVLSCCVLLHRSMPWCCWLIWLLLNLDSNETRLAAIVCCFFS